MCLVGQPLLDLVHQTMWQLFFVVTTAGWQENQLRPPLQGRTIGASKIPASSRSSMSIISNKPRSRTCTLSGLIIIEGALNYFWGSCDLKNSLEVPTPGHITSEFGF